jgi:glycosyltransferase involved in cell wall biosynthesis
MDNNIKVSIAIPCYGMDGRGGEFLEHSLTKIKTQTYKNVEVVISDHSEDNLVKDVVDSWSSKLNIIYVRNDYKRGSSSANINTAMKHCSGDIIKILFQDDFLYDNDSLTHIVTHFGESTWMVTSCEHTNDGVTMNRRHVPQYNDQIHLGVNTISSPSVVVIRNNCEVFFDDELIWLMDVEFYKRLYDKFGEPMILNIVTVVNRMWGSQVSNVLSDDIKEDEVKLMRKKYGNG